MSIYRVLKVSVPDRTSDTGCVEHFDPYTEYLVQRKFLWFFWDTVALPFASEKEAINHIHKENKVKEQTYIINI